MAPARDALDNRVVVVADADGERGAKLARAMVAVHAIVVLAGEDAGVLGALAAELVAAGARVAIFTGDAASETGRAAIVELVNELFAPRSS